MRIVVTGGAGLIGSHLIRCLLNAKHDVLCLDDFTHGYLPRPSDRDARAMAMRHEVLLLGATVTRCSTEEKTLLRAKIMEFHPEVIVHLAAIPLVSVATSHTEFAFRSLSVGLVNVLEVLRDAPFVRRFVYVSSSMVYGNFVLDPMPEEGPKNPINVYGGLKLAGEVLTQSYLYPTGIEYVILRPSAVYGPTDIHQRVVQKFCEGALAGSPILVKPRNDHIMDFTYVDDIAQGLFLACTHPAAANETFNVTFGNSRRLTELVDVLRQYVPQLVISNLDIDDADRPARGSLSIEKARRLLGYDPKWPLERGIPAYLEWLRGDTFEASQGAA